MFSSTWFMFTQTLSIFRFCPISIVFDSVPIKDSFYERMSNQRRKTTSGLLSMMSLV
jgi:hypothetical protein